jgi:hypothetical protein
MLRAARVGPPVGESHCATSAGPATGMLVAGCFALFNARSGRAPGYLRCSCAAEAVPCAPPAPGKTSGLLEADSPPGPVACAPGISAECGATLRVHDGGRLRKRRLISASACLQRAGRGARGSRLENVSKAAEYRYSHAFLPLTRTFCSATKRSDTPSGGKSLTALRQHHASEHQTCLAGQACFAAEEMSATPHHPGR